MCHADLKLVRITTVCGVPKKWGLVNGHPLKAQFNAPSRIMSFRDAKSGTDSLLITDSDNHVIRRFFPSDGTTWSRGLLSSANGVVRCRSCDYVCRLGKVEWFQTRRCNGVYVQL